MIVMKFGGTSIQDALCIQRVTEIVRSRLDLKPVLVFSAIGKTTRNLLNTAQMAAAGQYEQAVNEVDACCRYHLSLHKELSHHELSDPTESVILQYCREMKQILDSVFRESSLAPRQQDSLLAYGELMATKILTNFLNREGIPAFWMDARSLIITNTDFTRARPVLHETEIRIIRDVPSVVDEGKIPVIQGFIGSAENGETTTLGFEGSDFTASLIGSALNVSDIQIWKDVPGIMTADPDIIPNSFTVCEISYAEAEKLTQAGAKILHPDTLAPAREKAIPVHICHSKKPDGDGTVISVHGRSGANSVKSIACKSELCLIRLLAGEDAEIASLLHKIQEWFQKKGIPILTFKQEENIMIAIDGFRMSRDLEDELKSMGDLNIMEGMAALSLVGDNLSESEFHENIMHFLNGHPVHGLCVDESGHMVTLITEGTEIQVLMKRLHHQLFKQKDPTLFK